MRIPRDLGLYLAGRLVATIGVQIQSVAIGWQVYVRTGDPLDLGLVGLAQFLPMFVLALPAGSVADRFDRRKLTVICRLAYGVGAVLLAIWSATPGAPMAIVWAVLVLLGAARAFLAPATSALLPRLVRADILPRAIASSSGTFQLSTIAGPAVGGILYAAVGPVLTYSIAAGTQVVAAVLFAMTRPSERAAGEGQSEDEQLSPFERLIAGLRFIFARRVLLGAISLDLFAVLLGGAVALMPIYARDVLEVGEVGLGALRSAPAVGAGAVALFLALRPLPGHAGAWMFGCVAIFGVATIVFGLSTSFPLSLIALAVLGASDMVSVVVRQSLVQLHTPDAMRGRVIAVNMVFIGASNELGELESGVTAAWFGTVEAVVIGGVGTLIIVALWAWWFPGLRKIDRLETPER
jgi:MFS family permease